MVRVFLIFLFVLNLFGLEVYIESDKSVFDEGEYGEFSIVVKGNGIKLKDIIFPTLKFLDGQFIRDRDYFYEYDNKVKKEFRFYASNTFKIPKLKVKIKNKLYYTKPKTIKVKQNKILKDKIKCYKVIPKKIYANYPFRLNIICEANNNIKVTKVYTPVLWDFDIIKEEKDIKKLKLDKTIYFRRFLLSTNKSNVIIPNDLVDLEYKDKSYTIASNLYTKFNPINKGDFVGEVKKFEVSFDENRLYLKLDFSGSCKDIPPFELTYPNTTIIVEKQDTIQLIDTKKDLCHLFFKEVFFIKSEKDLIIEPFYFKYFDLNENKFKTAKTKKIIFKKNYTKPKNIKQPKIQRKIIYDFKEILQYIVLVVFILLFLAKLIFLNKLNQIEVLQKLNQTNEIKKIYELLIQCSNNYTLMQEVEKNLYEDKKINITKIKKEFFYEIIGNKNKKILKIFNYSLIITALILAGVIFI